MKKILFLAVVIASVFVSAFTFLPENVYAETENIYDMAEVTTLAPGGEIELYNKCTMSGTKTLSMGDSVKFAFKIGNFEKVTRVAFCIGSYGIYFYKNNNEALKFMACGYSDGTFTRGSVFATEENVEALKEYVNAVLKIETLSETKIKISFKYTIGENEKTIAYDCDVVSSGDMIVRYADAGTNQYSEFYIKSLLPAAVFGDGTFEYVNYNNNAGKNISGKCLLGVVGKDVAEKFGVPAGYSGNVLKIEGLTPTGSLDMSFDFSKANIARDRIRSIKFRIYVCKTDADTGSYPVLRIPDTGSTSSFQAHAIGQNTDRWIDIEFSAAQIDKICNNGKLEKFTFWLRCNARTITYIDNFVVDLVPLDEEDPVITAPVTEFTVVKGAYPFDDSVTVTDNSGVVNVKKVWSEGALDRNGRLTEGEHTLTVTATDASGNKSECVIKYIVKAEPAPKKCKIIFRAEGSDDYVFEYYADEADYILDEIHPPKAPNKPHYIGVWKQWNLEKTEEQIVTAEYMPIAYTATLTVDGKVYKTILYTAETKKLNLPAVPEKEGYTGKWSDYTLDFGDNLIIEAVYTEAPPDKPTPAKSGCRSDLGGSAVLVALAAVSVAALLKRKHK